MAGTFSACSFRIIGTAATPHNLLTIENLDATKIVTIRSITLQMDATAVLVAVMPLNKLSRTAAVPTGGTVLAKALFDTTNASNANTIVRGANASDGGAATAITATAGTTIAQEFGMRMHTVVGQVLSPVMYLPKIIDLKDLILRQDEAVMVQVVAAAGTSNPATNHWSASVVWDED